MQTENNTSKPEDSPEQETGEGYSGASCSASWFIKGTEYRKNAGYIEARNSLNPAWVVVDKDESSDSLPNKEDQERKSPASDGFKFNNTNEL